MLYIERKSCDRMSSFGFLFHEMYAPICDPVLDRFGNPEELTKWIRLNESAGTVCYPWTIADTGGYCDQLIVIPYTVNGQFVIRQFLERISHLFLIRSIEVHITNIGRGAPWPIALSWFGMFYPSADIVAIA